MFCTKCGNQFKDGYKFCPKCGTPAYVEREVPKSEDNNEINELVVDPKTEPNNMVSPISNAKNSPKMKASLKANNTDDDYKHQSKFISDSLIAKELHIEDVIERAEKGDKEAMLRQAFRYEIGIGCEMNKEKAASLYEQVKDNKELFPIEDLQYKSITGLDEMK